MLTVTSLTALCIKLLVIGHAINPEPFPAARSPRLATLVVVATFAIPLSWLKPRARVWYALALNAAGTAIAMVDLWHFRFYRDLPSIAKLDGLWQGQVVLDSLPALIRPMDVLALLDIFAVGAAVIIFSRRLDATRRVRPAWIAIGLTLIVVLGCARVIPVLRSDKDEVFRYAFQRQEIVGAVGLGGYHLYDLYINLLYPAKGRMTVSESDLTALTEELRERNQQQFVSRIAGIERGQNIILVSAESLQQFVLGLSIDGEPIAPNLTAFAQESMQFTQFYDQTHDGTTADAQFMSLNSLMPLAAGAVSTRYSSNRFRALPQVLKEHGYHTLSAVAEPPSFWNMGQMHPRLGFERSLFAADFRGGEWVGIGLDDATFFEQLLPVFRGQAQPFFTYLISSSNHHPYQLPAHLRLLRTQSLPDGMAGDYLQSVRYFDESFGQFISGLRRDGLLDRSVVVVFGDHQSWVDNPTLQHLWRSSGATTDATALQLWRFRRRVPLLIRLPRAAHSGIRDTPGGHLDITPTLLSLAGIEGVTGPWLGRDLTSTYRSLVIFRDGSVTDGETALIRESDGTEDCYLSDGEAIACHFLDSMKAVGQSLVRTSDRIIEGNLAPIITTRLAESRATITRTLHRVLVIAHRGDSVHYPENTLESIRAAFDLGADAAEIDIRLSRDGVPMVFHDDTLERTTNGHGVFERLTLAEAKALDAGSWMSSRFAGARIPTLEEVLRVAHGRGTLLLDLKVDGLARPVREVYERVGAKPEEALIGGWTPSQRAEFVREMPTARILKTEGAPKLWDADLFQRVIGQGLWGFEIGDYWPPPFMGDAALHGVPVIAYTIDDEPTMRRLIEAGVSGIETNDPSLMLIVAARLGAR